MRFLSLLLAGLLLCVSPVHAEGLPDLGDSSESVLPAAQEKAIGRQIMREIRADRSYLDDPELYDYLNNLGYRLVSSSAHSPQDFEFFLIQDASLNAFALPGGYIGVHTGTILAAQSESELASVLAHEIAHVTQHHIARMIAGQTRGALTSLAAVAVAILASRASPQAAEAAIATAQATQIQSQLDYTREHEREADRVGLAILDKSGFDTRAMAAFFERLQKSTRLYDSKAPSYLRTHPLTSERIADIQNRLDQMRYRQVFDSLDFQLVQAKVRASQGTPKEAVRVFESMDRENKYTRTALTYGYAAALARARDFTKAERELTQLRKTASHPMIESLAAQVKLGLNQPAAAQDIYRAAAKAYPQQRALFYGEVEILLQSGKADEALKRVNERLAASSGDPRLFELQAKSYAAQGKRLLQHRAQAEVYALKGNYVAAVEQLQIALRSGDGDFYQLSGAEARLRELRKLADAERAEKK